MNLEVIVAGAGIWGCTIARRLAEAGRKVLVLEKRAAVGGNCRCETDSETGIETHLYGSHIFHTRSEEVWEFANRFTRSNITVECNREFKLSELSSLLPVYYSGPIDALFGYKFGPLPWRTLNFELETLDRSDFQGASVVNYTEAEVPYTRIHEFKHYHPERTESMAAETTMIMREYPKTWKMGDEPYYPVGTPESAALLAKYQAELSVLNSQLMTLNSQLIVGGRLGAFKYYDMDQAVAAALAVEI